MTDTQEIIKSLSSLSYLGIFGVSLVANIFIPFPEEIVILALGYLAGAGKINVFILVPVIMAGLLISDIAMYYLSRGGSRPVMFFYNKFFAKRLEKKGNWVNNNLNKIVFFSRFLIQLRFLGPFLAGQSKMKFVKFLRFEIAALIIYVPLLVWAGWYFRNRIDNIVSGVGIVRNAILIFVGLLILIALFKYIRGVIFGKNTESDILDQYDHK